MHLSKDDLLDVYQRSLTLKDSLAQSIPFVYQDNNEKQKEKINKWSQIIAKGNQINFEKRFYWSGIDPIQIPQILSNRSPKENIQLPNWTKTLNQCLLKLSEYAYLPGELKSEQLLIPEFPLPFEEILVPFVIYARKKLKEELNADYQLISGIAHTELERSLLAWLANLNSLSMELEFTTFRASCQSGLKRAFSSKQEQPSREYYYQFIQHLLDGQILHYFKEYPVLAKLLATGVELWIESIIELISRLKKDKQQLAQVFNDGNDPGTVIKIKTSLSDRHNKGRSVMLLLFESGLTLVYKPKDLGIERAYNELLEGLHILGSPIIYKPFKVLNYGDYGWAEFVSSAPLKSMEQAQEYYKRAGGLLCLVYILGATDLHYENIIGNGEYPVLIDLETVLHPFAQETSIADDENAFTKARKLLDNSVIRTGLLPHWQTDGKDQAYDASGLGEFMPQDYSVEGLKWSAINTDHMQVRKEKIKIYAKETSDQFEQNSEYNLNHFANEIIEGFSKMFRFLMKHREVILHSSSWNSLSKQTIRFVFRPTKVYAQIERNLLYPQLLKNGIDRSIHLDILYSGTTTQDTPPFWWPLIETEQDAMEIMDIPHFSTRTDSDSLELPDGKSIIKYLTEPCFVTATERLKELNEKDLKQQVELIKATLLCRRSARNHITASHENIERGTGHDPLTKEMALKQGISIAAILKEKAIIAKDGSITWIAPKYHHNVKRYQVQPISHDLYDGTLGVSIFFSALYHLTQQKQYKDLALGALKIPLKIIEDADTTTFSLRESGAFSQHGSFIYGLLQAGKLTGERALLDATKKAALLVNKNAIDQDKIYDIVYGTAGTILTLLQVPEYGKDNSLLDTLQYAGDHLLKNRTKTPSGYKVWGSKDQRFLTGFSHGAAGIAYALLRLYQLTNNSVYKDAALEATAYENSVFNCIENNWPDFRRPEQVEEENSTGDKFMCTWCHGATGIGLARLATLDILDTAAIRKDIQAAIDTTRRYTSSTTDHVCCGNFGRLELLLAASQRFSDQDLYQFTLRRAGEIIALAEYNGDFRYNPYIGFTPGFFQGIAGIGYQILRLAFPDVLPSVLTLN